LFLHTAASFILGAVEFFSRFWKVPLPCVAEYHKVKKERVAARHCPPWIFPDVTAKNGMARVICVD
jgi:hypothetical protein